MKPINMQHIWTDVHHCWPCLALHLAWFHPQKSDYVETVCLTIKKMKLPVKSCRNPLHTFFLALNFAAGGISSSPPPRAVQTMQPCSQHQAARCAAHLHPTIASDPEPVNMGRLTYKPRYEPIYEFHNNTALLLSRLCGEGRRYSAHFSPAAHLAWFQQSSGKGWSNLSLLLRAVEMFWLFSLSTKSSPWWVRIVYCIDQSEEIQGISDSYSQRKKLHFVTVHPSTSLWQEIRVLCITYFISIITKTDSSKRNPKRSTTHCSIHFTKVPG